MKKVVVGIFLLLILFIAFAYLFVPGQVEIKTSSVIKVSPQAATRILTKTNEWEKWWPPSEIGVSTPSTLKYNKSSYKIHQHLSNGFDITILDTPDSVHSLLTLLPLHIDSLEVQWNGISNTGINPFKRISTYLKLKQIKNHMDGILASMKRFLENQKNVYGIDIRRQIVQDTLVVVKEGILPEFPSNSSIYSTIQELRKQIKNHGARETNPPMLNIEKQSNASYHFMVAIPIDREIQVTRGIAFKRLVRGYILVADIQGGPATVAKGFEEMKNFISDYSRSPVAIPFESLVTERNLEADTSKWKTRIYFPIIL